MFGEMELKKDIEREPQNQMQKQEQLYPTKPEIVKERYSERQLADVVCFFTEGSDKAIKVYLQCDKSSVDAGILLVSGMDIVDKDEISDDMIGHWQEVSYPDAPSHGIYAQKVEEETMTKLMLQGAARLEDDPESLERYFFVNLDEPIEVSFSRAFDQVTIMQGDSNRSNLFEQAFLNKKEIYERLMKTIENPTQEQVSTQSQLTKIKTEFDLEVAIQKAYSESRKKTAQSIDCNIHLKERYEQAREREKTSGLGTPTIK